MSKLAVEDGINVVKKAFNFWLNKKGYAKYMEKVAIKSAGEGHCTAEIRIEEDMTNPSGTLHGGCTATLIDVISSLGLLTHKNATTGVSVNISINFLKAAKPGDLLIIDSKATKVGKNLAYLDVSVRNKETGALVATGSHVKFLG